MEAVLSNRDFPEYGSVKLTFPIKQNQYGECLRQLRTMEIGDAVAQDCCVDSISDTIPYLDCLTGQQVNLDELDFLAHCVEEFWDDEPYQFEASASALGLTSIRDLINLTQSVYNVTVIWKFSNLKDLGRTHYLHMKGGSAPSEEVDSIDPVKVMMDLIASGQGQVTPYGVYYGNGMELLELYKGAWFPERNDGARAMAATLTRLAEPENADDYVLLHLPVPDEFLSRALIRGGLENEERICVALYEEMGPEEIVDVIGDEHIVTMDSGFLEEINALSRTVYNLPYPSLDKLGAVIRYAEPKTICQIQRLAEHLSMFEFVPKVKTPEEYARILLRDIKSLVEFGELDAFF
ncbi:MAG: hypothetical protein J6X53_06525, partial [Abditibacteriota bacterium]|nr:hypothetical protein [Abditibacteriota bacterium]